MDRIIWRPNQGAESLVIRSVQEERVAVGLAGIVSVNESDVPIHVLLLGSPDRRIGEAEPNRRGLDDDAAVVAGNGHRQHLVVQDERSGHLVVTVLTENTLRQLESGSSHPAARNGNRLTVQRVEHLDATVAPIGELIHVHFQSAFRKGL